VRIIIKPYNQLLRFTWPFAFLNYLFLPKGQAQAVELSGKNCQVNSVSFEDGAVGKVYVTDGACRPVVTGAEIAVE
jgi:hypothetical protein